MTVWRPMYGWCPRDSYSKHYHKEEIENMQNADHEKYFHGVVGLEHAKKALLNLVIVIFSSWILNSIIVPPLKSTP